jgi:hypothetical protein
MRFWTKRLQSRWRNKPKYFKEEVSKKSTCKSKGGSMEERLFSMHRAWPARGTRKFCRSSEADRSPLVEPSEFRESFLEVWRSSSGRLSILGKGTS